ncbi:MAG TPA: YihY/virulence factor BrkB family protein [Rhodopila sp.]|uniref:YihY/virulence factor BrkB family protein n=1 Tax=Rhodopila sp. TaxID=2480087 RepID=UPI002B60E481|nr:YihY/virulence factor BrkB family protein [Rhodopila sp.]HVY15252.1 YihY/virulence factor BrkB family protein [Rhodopila sp.]
MSASDRLNRLKDDLAAATPRSPGEAGTLAARPGSPTSPWRISPRGWFRIMKRSWTQVNDNNIFLAAGGVTYAILVALFPGLAALVSIYGLLLDPVQVERQVAALARILPPDSAAMIGSELHQLVTTSANALSISAALALLLALWSASRGMSGMINALDLAYGEKETRGFVRLNLIAIALTLFVLIGGTVTIALVGVLPVVVKAVGLGSFTSWVLLIVQWPLLIGVVLAGLAVLYYYGPDRKSAQWRWISPGALIATVLWLIGSLGFSIYVSHFSSYDKTYGSLGGVVVMLTWLWLSSFVALFGAVIDSEVER